MHMGGAGLALGVTLLIEVPVVAALFPGQRVRMAIWALAMNTATNLGMNVLLPRIALIGVHYVVVGELLALFGEAAVYVIVSRPRDVARALLASSLSNALSFAGGGLVGSALVRLSAFCG